MLIGPVLKGHSTEERRAGRVRSVVPQRRSGVHACAVAWEGPRIWNRSRCRPPLVWRAGCGARRARPCARSGGARTLERARGGARATPGRGEAREPDGATLPPAAAAPGRVARGAATAFDPPRAVRAMVLAGARSAPPVPRLPSASRGKNDEFDHNQHVFATSIDALIDAQSSSVTCMGVPSNPRRIAAGAVPSTAADAAPHPLRRSRSMDAHTNYLTSHTGIPCNCLRVSRSNLSSCYVHLCAPDKGARHI